MSATRLELDQAIVDRYTDQPSVMPLPVRRCIEDAWGGMPIQGYACADLDAEMQLTAEWVALGPRDVAIARQDALRRWSVQRLSRTLVGSVHRHHGLSCTVAHLVAIDRQAPLAVVRFTHRQRRAMETVLRQIMESEATPVAPPAADATYAARVAGPIKDAQALVAKNSAAVLWRLLGYLRPYRARVIAGMAAASLITLLSLVPPYLAGFVIDRIIRPVQAGSLSVTDGAAMAWLAVSALAVVMVIRQVSGWVRLRVMSVLGEYVARDLRTEVYNHLQQLSLSFYSRKKTGSLITRVSSDTDRLWEFLALGVVDVSLAIVMIVGLGIVLLSLDWKLGLVMTIPVPVLCAFIFAHGRRMARLFTRAWRRWSLVNDVLSDTIPGMRVVKAFNQEEREKERFRQRNVEATRDFTRIHHVWTSFWPALMLVIHGLTVAVWVFALPRLMGTESAPPTLSPGTFVSFLLYMTMFVAPVEIIGQMARVLNRATTSAHRIFEVLDTEPEIVDASVPVRVEPVRGHLVFDEVTFAYDGGRDVVRGMTFEVHAGEMIGLVGPSGGGKTTIANLVARFHDPQRGSVRVDGVDLREIDTGHYRRQVGMVLQDPHLFHGTVADNIRYGLPNAETEQVVAAAQAANAHDFICRLPHGYDTIVGERGQNLSGGERQRVSIARAILSNPRILILDEATSSVDTETEAKIQQAMDRLVFGRTVIAIAHRLSTLRRASRLLVVENGRITESGTHAELIAKPASTYRRLYMMQRDVQHVV
jgi:ATP-binding cassette, subfamily B, bacterial